MDLARFLALIQTSALAFPAARLMTDRWEGSYGRVNAMLRPEWYSEMPQMIEQRPMIRRAVSSMIHLSCWHVADHESAAMWDLYQREGRGVAIQSTWSNLTFSITDEEPIYGARVAYEDYESLVISEDNVFNPYLYKRRSFAHEREARLLAMSDALASGEHPEVMRVSVDLATLIDRVYVAPDAPEWVVEVVRDVVRVYQLEVEVTHSDLDGDPIA